HRIERVEPRLRRLGELGWVEKGNLLAQRRVVAKGKLRRWWRLGPEMHSDTPCQEEHHEHPCQRQAASSAAIPEYSTALAVFTENSVPQWHQTYPSHSFSRVRSCLTSKRRCARGLPPILRSMEHASASR